MGQFGVLLRGRWACVVVSLAEILLVLVAGQVGNELSPRFQASTLLALLDGGAAKQPEIGRFAVDDSTRVPLFDGQRARRPFDELGMPGPLAIEGRLYNSTNRHV